MNWGKRDPFRRPQVIGEFCLFLKAQADRSIIEEAWDFVNQVVGELVVVHDICEPAVDHAIESAFIVIGQDRGSLGGSGGGGG